MSYNPKHYFHIGQKKDVPIHSHHILNKGKNHFCQLLNLQSVNDVQQTTIQIAALVVCTSCDCEDEFAV